MEARRCTAFARTTGKRCGRRPIPGGTVCVMHGGATPAVRAAADRRRAEQQATALLEVIWDPNAAPVTNAVEALQALVGRLQHAANVLGARMESDGLDGAAAIAWAKVLRELRQALVGMERLDLDNRVLELEQERASLVTSAFRAAIAVVELLPADRSLMVSTFLRSLGASDEVVDEPPVVRGELG